MKLSDLPGKIRARAETLVRRTWMKYALSGVGQNDAHDRLERAYRLRDPWKLDSAPEHFRFAETNRILARELGDIESLLEIGCGEGLQSVALSRTCARLTGVDVSPTAVARARARLPSCSFSAGDLFSQPWSDVEDAFDVVVGCEVLYYLSDVPRTLDRMERLARRACLVSYFAPAERKVGAPVSARRGVRRETIRFGEVEWVVAWWPS